MRRALITFALLAIACQQERSVGSVVEESVAAPPAAPAGQADGSTSTASQSRMIIRTAAITLVVEDAVESMRRAVTLVESRGGYVAETQQWRENDQVRTRATLRIPAESLFEVLPQIKEGAIRVESETVSGEDVSEEFSDLGARLRNLQATETELRELLATVRQRSQKAADILEVHNELTRVRGEIERIQGRMNFLTQRTSFSTIKLELIPDLLAKPVVEPGWRPAAVAKNASRALVNTLKGLAEAAIWTVIYLLPIALLFVAFVLVVRFVWKSIRRSGRTSAAPSDPPAV